MGDVRFNGADQPNPGNFSLVRWREGYAAEEVDALLARIAAGTITSDEIRGARLRPVRIRLGYDMGQVDDYLDKAEAEFRARGQ